MKTFTLFAVLMLLHGCAAVPQDSAARRSQIRDCPAGWVLVCESARPQDPSSGGDEEIPVYDRCRCEDMSN